jgi:putative selenium metabolism hydrolase
MGSDRSDLDACIDFVQRLIQTESLPGCEGEIAGVVMAEMERLGYVDVHRDRMGNVLGRIAGTGEADPLMLNTHLDHVDVGDHSAWPHPPFGGEIHDGRIWGRGAVDIKGPLAAQVYGAARLANGRPPAGDVWVTAVVQEEIGGVGARFMARQAPAQRIVIGEPTGLEIRRGHRGRMEVELRIRGRSVHASVPELGVNPLISLGRFLAELESVAHSEAGELGLSTVAPTLLSTDQTSPNVVPAEVVQTLDWRNVPGETQEIVIARLRELVDRTLAEGATAELTNPVTDRVTYTGEHAPMPSNNPTYLLASGHPLVDAARQIAARALGRELKVGVWRFATDGGHFAAAGLEPVGFGPGDEGLAHTIDEHLEIEQLEAALDVNEAFARELTKRATALDSVNSN